jgi:hypothetical protein
MSIEQTPLQMALGAVQETVPEQAEDSNPKVSLEFC